VAVAQTSAEEERLLKAVFVYNFAKFTRWPEYALATDDGQVTLCTVGEGELIGELEQLGGRSIKGRTLTVLPLQSVEFPRRCHLLYVAESEADRYSDLIEAMRSEAVLTVSGLHGFAHAGGIIELYRDQGRIRFLINLAAAREAGLEISARLLSLADVVEQESRP